MEFRRVLFRSAGPSLVDEQAPMNKLIVFDCDGTLVDSQANIIQAMEAAFIDHGLQPPDPHVTRRVVGLSLVQAMHRLLPEAEPDLHDQMAESYKRAFHALRGQGQRSEEHTSELQSLMRISYA